MGTVATQDFISKKRIGELKGALREIPPLRDITNVSQDDLEYLPRTDPTAIEQRPGKKQRLMHPVRPIDTNVGTVKSANGKERLMHPMRPIHTDVGAVKSVAGTTKSAKGKAPTWTPKEDEALRNSVKTNNGRNWKLIAESVPNRSDVQCLHRWQKVLNPILVKGYWTKEEDTRMVELVQMFGMKRWAAIARCLPGRNGKQCRERWCNHLDPKISRDAWTEAEDMMLFLAHSTWGNKWAEISKLLPGRSDNGVKNRWNTSVKKRAKSMEQYTKFLHLQSPVNPSPAKPTATHPDLMAGGDHNARNNGKPTATYPDLMADGDHNVRHNAELYEEEEIPCENYLQGFTSYSKVVVRDHNVRHNAELYEQEEIPCENYLQGFTSYSKVVVHDSPPNPQRIECSLSQIRVFESYLEVQESSLMTDSYLNAFEDR